jgi:hypothetical protein
MKRSVGMKGIFLSSTHARAPQSFAERTIPIGERCDPAGSVIDCVHRSRKWVARRGPILLARMRSLLLAQILPSRRRARSPFANLSTREWPGSRRDCCVARVLRSGGHIQRTAIYTRAAIRLHGTSHGSKIQRTSSSATHSPPAGFDDRRRRWRPARNRIAR